MLNRIRTILAREGGPSAAEYGLLVATIAAIIIGVVILLSADLTTAFAGGESAVGGAN